MFHMLAEDLGFLFDRGFFFAEIVSKKKPEVLIP
jgi:hypothetical protein